MQNLGKPIEKDEVTYVCVTPVDEILEKII